MPCPAQALECAWRLHWWRRPLGRALELLLCELHARLHGWRVKLDLESCTLRCGPQEGHVLDVSSWGGPQLEAPRDEPQQR